MLCAHAEKYHGTAGKAFIQELVKDIPSHIDRIKTLIEQFKRENTPPNAVGQVLRVLNRFALIAAAGTLATELGIAGPQKRPCGPSKHASKRGYKIEGASRLKRAKKSYAKLGTTSLNIFSHFLCDIGPKTKKFESPRNGLTLFIKKFFYSFHKQNNSSRNHAQNQLKYDLLNCLKKDLMDILNISDDLKREALEILSNQELWTPFLSRGKIHLTGSSFLDVLVYPDLDLYFEANDSSEVLPAFAEAAQRNVHMEAVRTIEFQKDLHLRYPALCPVGTFMQLRYDNGNQLWKIDIWAMKSPAKLKKKLDESSHFKKLMTPEKREIILSVKHRLAAPFGRTPVGSSYLVYVAVLKKGLTDLNEIMEYIRSQGGNIDKLK